MAGRDVRRLAARASTQTFEAKRDAVARIAAGADAAGATDIYIVEEPFRVASRALEWMPLKARVHTLKIPLSHDASDSEAAVRAYIDRGAAAIVSLGGDGTNRAIARALTQDGCAAAEVDLVPLSTGTNNVFPVLIEPTVAGLVAGLAARGLVPDEFKPRCKVLRIALTGGVRDLALIDAAYLADDFIGNMRPFDATKIRQLLLTRAEPDAIGMSPVGGCLQVVEAHDDHGLLLRMGEGRTVNAPVSPGLFREVSIASVDAVQFDTPVIFRGNGVLALDGDREHKLNADSAAYIRIRRDGPRVLDVPATMRHATREGLLGGCAVENGAGS
jgi:hypothetical protein